MKDNVIYDYFDNIFCLGSGQTYGYKSGNYLINYTVEKIDNTTLEAIKRKMEEMNLEIKSWDIGASEFSGRIVIRMFIGGEIRNEQ